MLCPIMTLIWHISCNTFVIVLGGKSAFLPFSQVAMYIQPAFVLINAKIVYDL